MVYVGRIVYGVNMKTNNFSVLWIPVDRNMVICVYLMHSLPWIHFGQKLNKNVGVSYLFPLDNLERYQSL
jgi:hypothetical protein